MAEAKKDWPWPTILALSCFIFAVSVCMLDYSVKVSDQCNSTDDTLLTYEKFGKAISAIGLVTSLVMVIISAMCVIVITAGSLTGTTMGTAITAYFKVKKLGFGRRAYGRR